MGMAEHTTLDTGQMTSMVFYESRVPTAQGRRVPNMMQNHMRAHPGAVGGRLCSARRMRRPLVLRGGCDCLV